MHVRGDVYAEQEPRDVEVALLAGDVEGRIAMVRGLVHVRGDVFAEEEPHDVEVPPAAGRVEGRGANATDLGKRIMEDDGHAVNKESEMVWSKHGTATHLPWSGACGDQHLNRI